jgi:hypothetical protein
MRASDLVMPVFGVIVIRVPLVVVAAVPGMTVVIGALMTPPVLVHDNCAVIVVVMMPLACPEEHASDKHSGQSEGAKKNGMRGCFHKNHRIRLRLNLTTSKISRWRTPLAGLFQ